MMLDKLYITLNRWRRLEKKKDNNFGSNKEDKMKKILLLGQDGMLGGELSTRLKNKGYDVYDTTIQTLDICDETAVVKKAEEVMPDFIINCAAYTNVDGCETNFELANKVNGLALANIAKAANQVGATLLQISTDYVFDGTLDVTKEYTEDMETNPVSAYGKTKLLGEQNAAEAEKYYILRTAWLYGLGGKNFVKTMLQLAKTNEEIAVVCDQHGSPTSTTTLCEIIEQVLEKEPAYGIYHATNEGFTVWSDFAKKIFDLANVPTKVDPITSEEYKRRFPNSSDRPANSKLLKNRLHQVGIFPKKWEDALAEYLKEELK